MTDSFELRAFFFPRHHIPSDRFLPNLPLSISPRFASPRAAIHHGVPHPVESGRSSGNQLGFQGLRTRGEAYRRAVEANSYAGRANWVGRWLHVQEGFVIAGLEVYWVVTSKKLKVMYFPPYYTDMLCHFITTQTRKQLGRFSFSSALWLMCVGYDVSMFMRNSANLFLADDPFSRRVLVQSRMFPIGQMERTRSR